MLSALPAALISLLFVLPVFAQSTSSNDPLRAVALQAPKPKQPDNPICCLKPITPLEPVDDGILLSFEEWKAKQFGMQQMPEAPPKTEEKEGSSREAPAGGGDAQFRGDASNASDTLVSPMVNTGSAGPVEATQATPEYSDFSLYLNMIPTTDRFNYASLDCSARVHTSHRSAKSPTSILSSKRDRYMLSPCDTKEQQFVVVELCDDIRIDTVQLANFEFFSGVFKDFTVRVSDRYPANPSDLSAWTTAGSYRAKNVRGVQTFHPPTSLRDFVRFIRIDFHSHYGNEFYCPVSLLRVYGLTHLEEWKWDIWESEGRAKQAELHKRRQLPLSTEDASIPSVAPKIPESVPDSRNKPQQSTEQTVVPPITAHNPNYSSTERPEISPTPSVTVSSFIPNSTARSASSSTSLTRIEASTSQTQFVNSHPNSINGSHKHSTDTFVTTSISTPPIPIQSTTQDNIPTPEKFENTTQDIAHTSSTSLQAHQSSSISHSHSGTSTVIVSSNFPSVAIIPVPPPPPVTKGGESIYRTILNRLSEVEINQTLYMRYIEQQNMAVRDVIKRLGEDVGRLEGITRAQAMNYQRNLDSWQRQRSQLESEYVDLVLRVEHLSEEIVLEKRLGVAQLCLLLAVLVFMGLTRGSRAEAMIDHSSSRLNKSVREWSERHLRLSGNWTGRFKGKNLEIQTGRRNSLSSSRNTSRTRTPQTFSRPKPLSAKTYPAQPQFRSLNDDDKIQFPSTSIGSNILLDSVTINTAPVGTEYFNRPRTCDPRARVPSLRSTPANRRIHHQRPVTPISSSFRPQILQRSNSHGGPGLPQSASWGTTSVPKSAKRWARSAHLHEVKTLGPLISAGARRSRKKSGENISPPTRHDRSQDQTPREFEFDREACDLFSAASVSKGKLTTEAYEGSLLFKMDGPSANTTLDEGDVWIDTDSVDGSELDAEQVSDVTNLIQFPS
ncbi:hypothetical protein BDN70DRAFT_880260 [Pholiota conissans]|uniref:SUN domain-containing protein n=1 Tax=Pholiota conissans TaxID=109636 RepID=A0A9P5Z1T4_9AGAR|nr:hypothetical protein BDN70DRAFT_880260 [Pholiota conissans]